MKQERIKRNLKEKGITLVALVVTIIILLILAGVTLNLALGEGGIFARAKNTVDRYQSAQANELDQLTKLEEMLNNYGQGGNTEGTGDPTPPTVGTGSSEIADGLKEYQGKYVDIGVDINSTNGTIDDWEVFYATKDRIFLIAADYVTVDKLTDWGVMGSLKSNGLTSYRSYVVCWNTPTGFLTLPTTPDNFSSLVMHTGYTLNQNNDSSIAVSHLLNTDKWKGIKDVANVVHPNCVDFVIGGPTLEMWCSAWNIAVDGDETFKQIQPDGSGSGGYYVGCEATNQKQKDYLNMDGKQTDFEDKLVALGNNYKTFFPHTSMVDICRGYWLSSPNALYSNYLMFVGYDGKVGGYGYSCHDFGVRPLVSLATGVRILEIEEEPGRYKIAD